ncbi:hypothetical protein [uncultured Cohaesibacter sp.]|uniref:hypothetical protein n=1 Tax=uncultured Cohaesibacter sp. TaxID=1002546 RepID=UPI0029C7FD6F|nr:hypothetical protein [uncultured Cohaesibacter sp.]
MQPNLPTFALSVRQPWAWAIIHAGKDIENRSWQAINRGLANRGPIAIHAAKGMSAAEYISAREYMLALGVTCPHPAELVRSAIIGHVTIADIVSKSDSPWFMGPRGLVLRDPVACNPIAASGQLGFFKWQTNLLDTPSSPLPWMTSFESQPWMEKLGENTEHERKWHDLFYGEVR